MGAISYLGRSTTANGNSAKSEERVICLEQACHQWGILPNLGAVVSWQYHWPLTVAAYYGYHSAIQLLIKCNALPDLHNGKGKNAFMLALENPTGRTSCLRGCNKCMARMLLDLSVVTTDLGLWKRAPCGTLSYIMNDRPHNSAMFWAIYNKNIDQVKFLCNAGSAITDRDYLFL